MIKIVLDVFSGDNPGELIRGAAEAVNKYPEVTLLMPGDREYLESELKKYSYDKGRIEVLDASEIITNNESPTLAIRQKRNSSLVVGMTRLKEDADGLISAGSTGAVLCGGIFIAGRLEGIDRPALCAVLPTATGGNVALMDCGANADCLPEYLAQFAVLGSALMKSVYGVEEPKVALLSVGTEDHKGNKLTQAAFPLLKALPINFVGNMESRETLSGSYDVVVSDGFTGNVVLKSIEGTAKLVINKFVGSLKKNMPEGTDGSFIKKAVGELMLSLDFNSNGGAVLLGCKKPIEKIHGSSNASTIVAVVGQLKTMIETDMIGKIKSVLQ